MKEKLVTRNSAIKTLLTGGVIALIGRITSWFNSLKVLSIILIVLGALIMIAGIALMFMVAIKENDSK